MDVLYAFEKLTFSADRVYFMRRLGWWGEKGVFLSAAAFLQCFPVPYSNYDTLLKLELRYNQQLFHSTSPLRTCMMIPHTVSLPRNMIPLYELKGLFTRLPKISSFWKTTYDAFHSMFEVLVLVRIHCRFIASMKSDMQVKLF